MALPIAVQDQVTGKGLPDLGILQQLIAQGNFPVTKYVKNVAGIGTAAAGDMTGADFVNLELENDSAYAYTTRTAAQMAADLGVNFFVGMSFMLLVVNSGNGTVTMTAGTGVTIVETATLATLTTRLFMCTFTSATAFSMTSVSVGSIET